MRRMPLARVLLYVATAGALSLIGRSLLLGPIPLPVAIGAFADPGSPAPWFSVYEERKHPWVAIVGEGIEHID